MSKRKKRSDRDIEKGYPSRQFVTKLRRLADCIEQGRRFRIQVAGDVQRRARIEGQGARGEVVRGVAAQKLGAVHAVERARVRAVPVARR